MPATALHAPAATVISLTHQRINQVSKELKQTTLGQKVGGAVASVFSQVAYKLATVALGRLASKFTDDAIWFKGVTKEAWDQNLDLRDAQGQMLPRLDLLKDQLATIRQRLLSVKASSPAIPRELLRAVEAAVASVVDLFDAVEDFRWVLLELEANHSPRVAGYGASSPEAVAQLFQRLHQTA